MTRQFFTAFLLVLLCSPFASAQIGGRDRDRRGNDDYFETENRRSVDSDNPFWYGTGAILSFSAGNFQSRFQIGITPMVGYKITNFLSVGPRGALSYNSFRFDLGGDVSRNRYWEWQAGLFGRANIFRGIFAHVEYSLVSEEDIFLTNAGDIETQRTTRGIPFGGLGLQQGGGPGAMGFEIILLFRLTSPDRLNDQPFEFRTGLNYNF